LGYLGYLEEFLRRGGRNPKCRLCETKGDDDLYPARGKEEDPPGKAYAGYF
jgi:hypothetical protein